MLIETLKRFFYNPKIATALIVSGMMVWMLAIIFWIPILVISGVIIIGALLILILYKTIQPQKINP